VEGNAANVLPAIKTAGHHDLLRMKSGRRKSGEVLCLTGDTSA